MVSNFYLFIFIKVQLIYNVILASGVQQSDSVTSMNKHISSFSDSFRI